MSVFSLNECVLVLLVLDFEASPPSVFFFSNHDKKIVMLM